MGAIQELDSCCCNEPNELDLLLHEVGAWSRHQFYIVTGLLTAICGMMNEEEEDIGNRTKQIQNLHCTTLRFSVIWHIYSGGMLDVEIKQLVE